MAINKNKNKVHKKVIIQNKIKIKKRPNNYKERLER